MSKPRSKQGRNTETHKPVDVPTTAASLLLRGVALQVSGGGVLFAAAACLHNGLDRETVVTMVCSLLGLTDPDTNLVADLLLGLPFPETEE